MKQAFILGLVLLSFFSYTQVTAQQEKQMPQTAKAVADQIGFINPELRHTRLEPGTKVRFTGSTPHGRYDLTLTIEAIQGGRVTIGMDGVAGGYTFGNNGTDLPLIFNRPFSVRQLFGMGPIPADLFMAFIAIQPQSRPTAGTQVDVAMGEVGVSNTDPPPRRPPPSR